jgi:hypothetical protein
MPRSWAAHTLKRAIAGAPLSGTDSRVGLIIGIGTGPCVLATTTTPSGAAPGQKEHIMNTTHKRKRMIAGAAKAENSVPRAAGEVRGNTPCAKGAGHAT